MTILTHRMTDPEKLRALAEWFDKYDDRRGYSGERSVQADLRRIAENLDWALDIAIEQGERQV